MRVEESNMNSAQVKSARHFTASLQAGLIQFTRVVRDCEQILVLAPVGTPYARGAFLFDVFFPSDYPASPPKARSLSRAFARCESTFIVCR
jgi:ubiquitin-protein ligase